MDLGNYDRQSNNGHTQQGVNGQMNSTLGLSNLELGPTNSFFSPYTYTFLPLESISWTQDLMGIIKNMCPEGVIGLPPCPSYTQHARVFSGKL